MIRKKILAAIALVALLPVFASAQTYDTGGNVKNVNPAIPETNAVLSTACSTPLTPTSCASTSYAIYPIGAQGVGSYSFQFNAVNGGTFAFEASNDCVNFIATSLAQNGTTPITTTSTVTATGIYTGIGAARACIAIVATVAPTSTVTVVPFASQKVGDVGVFNAASLTVANPGAFPTFPSSLTIGGIPAPCATDSSGACYTHAIAMPTDGNAVPYSHPTGAPYPVQTDSAGGVPNHVINTSPIPVLPSAYGGLGGDIAFATLGTISNLGTILSVPTGTRIVYLKIPPGASGYYYIGTAQMSTSTAAIAIAQPFGCPATAITTCPLSENIVPGTTNMYITQYSPGTTTPYNSGDATYRGI